MAILGSASPRTFSVDALIDAMQRLAGAVIRITVGGQPSSTGWFIAPQVVVVPGFAIRAGAAGPVQILGAQGREWSGVPTEAPEDLGEVSLSIPYDGPALTVLHLTAPAPERVLPLCFDPQTAGDPVCLLHFPLGRPDIHASFGQIRSADENLIGYDADTQPGSSGAPILDSSWRVLGMHVVGDANARTNYGLPRSVILKVLRRSKWWPEIASHHNLADVAAAKAVLRESMPEPSNGTPEPILVRAAISPSLNPKSLSASERETLGAAVADTSLEHWTLRPSERRRIIAAMGTLDALQPFRRRSRRKDAGPLQRALDRVLDGPPYRLADASEEELAWCIQAARWFEPVAEELPKPAEIARELERRRVRSRLVRIAGAKFQGRKKELALLRDWYRRGEGPMALTGIGGIGKSALVARFASERVDDILLLWLDFDRPDLAPDDAISVLAALSEQAAIQLDGLEKSSFGEATWQDDARRFGERLAKRVGRHAPLLVLDSFEAAQYTERYQELWPVLEQLVQALPQLRVCVTGRAPVPDLRLGGKEAEVRHLMGLDEADVRVWLRSEGIKQVAAVNRVVEIARGIPLVFRLAFRLLEAGGKVTDLPRDLPNHLISGYLYDRILDRVQNPEFKPLTCGLLALRRLTLDMIMKVMDGLVPFPPGEPSSWFAELSREMALVAGGDVLIPRAEVRSATLWLLEHDRPELVRSVDERAAAWYADNGAEAPEDAAELVYHRLRLGQIDGAEQAWRDGCGAFLTYAAEDIRDTVSRAWLQQRLGVVVEAPRPLAVWEQDAAERIRSARGRKLDRAIGEILRERSERSEHSPLLFHDAHELHVGGENAKARDLLDSHGSATGPSGRDRTLLRALLALEENDRRTADALLATIDQPAHWSDRPTAQVDALAVVAARINLTVDLTTEGQLLERSNAEWSKVQRMLGPVDVASPRLRAQLRRSVPGLETAPAHISVALDFDGNRLLEVVEQERSISLPDEPESLRRQRHKLLEEWSHSDGRWHTAYAADPKIASANGSFIPQIAELGWRRWWLAARLPFLVPAYQLCVRETPPPSPVVPSIVGTLALFATPFGTVWVGGSNMPLYEALRHSVFGRGAILIRKQAWPQLRRLLESSVDPQENWDRYIKTEQDQDLVFWADDLLHYSMRGPKPDLAGTFLLHLFAPDPLRKLVDDVAGALSSPPLT